MDFKIPEDDIYKLKGIEAILNQMSEGNYSEREKHIFEFLSNTIFDIVCKIENNH